MTVVCENHYSFGKVRVAFDDDFLGENFCRAYGFSYLPATRKPYAYVVKGQRGDYVALSTTTGEGVRGTGEASVGYLDNQLDTLFRTNVREGYVSVHASSSCILGKAIMCIGLSNSGKTTLSLAIAAIGDGFIGDEYALIRLSDGCLRHEKYPVQLKMGSKCILGSPSHPGLPVLRESGMATEAFLPEDFGIATLDGPRRIGMFLFPSYSPFQTKPAIEILGLKSLPEFLMPSITGRGARAGLFASILHLLARYEIPCYSVKYSDCCDAALAVRNMFMDELK